MASASDIPQVTSQVIFIPSLSKMRSVCFVVIVCLAACACAQGAVGTNGHDQDKHIEVSVWPDIAMLKG
jgi:hypothetical protein